MKKKSNGKKAIAPKQKTSSGGPMNVALLQQMVDLMSANDLNTIDVRDGDKRVILKRGAVQAMYAAPALAAAPAASAASAAGSGAPAAPAAADADAGLVPIKSPMVGTFYSKPTPDAKSFVTVGATVDEDTDVCIIEAMKVFNAIKAETRGTIAKVLHQDGAPVEFGTVLFLVKP